ncbi:MAG TPA: pyridoxal-phosphate dependent enzyme [Thermoplasmata archaeon]|nr:pyridoxal-phosphate dependent enzyme [Thermoplasmata archaeon]
MPETPRVLGSILDLVGNTPLVPLRRVAQGLPYRVLAKLEFLNPGGSVKDRIGASMIEEAERTGRLKPGGTLVEATSGNTGVGLALVAAVRGYRTVFVIPDKMSSEKIRLLRAYGARVVVTPSGVPPEHPMSHYSVAQRLAREIPGAYYPNQYQNQGNPDAHYRTTGPEIDRDAGPGLGAVIGTVGTGGTMSGVGRYFKEHRPSVRIVAVDPEGSVLGGFFRTGTTGKAVPYQVEGIGEDMVPGSIHFEFLDEFVEVNDRESFQMARRLARDEGFFVGGSSGSAVAGALKWLAKRPLPDGAAVVVLLPDSGDRYLTKFYSDDWMREKGFLDVGATARELVGRKGAVPALVAVEPTTVVRDALALLRQHGFAVLPVLSGTTSVGTVQEDHILHAGLIDETVLDRSVRQALSPPLPEVSADAPVSEVLHRFKEEGTLLVRDSTTDAPVGVLTRHDLVGYLSEMGGTDAV